MKKQLAILLLLVSPTLLLAGKFWNEKPYIEWTQKEASQMLTDSPWMEFQVFKETGYDDFYEGRSPGGSPRTVNIPRSAGGAPQGRARGPGQRSYEMRFQSARPVRMALARLYMLGGQWTQEQSEQFIENEQAKQFIILAVRTPQDTSALNETTLPALQETTHLELKRDKRKVGLEHYVSPQDSGDGWAYFIFPKEKDGNPMIRLEDREIRFRCRLNENTKLDRKFKLKNMVFQGNLEI